MGDLGKSGRKAWGGKVIADLQGVLGDLSGKALEVHAGALYVEAISPFSEAAGARITQPLKGLRLGEQLRWYNCALPPPGEDPR